MEVRYFAAAADAAGRDSEAFSAPNRTVAEVVEQVVGRHGSPMERIIARGSILCDGVLVRDYGRPAGARLDVLPPFSGG